jgi:glutamyl-tRNA(Gln) amidotransferase subunit E
VKAGLEVHQQLATHKLFCACPTELSESVVGQMRRELHATSGEDQLIDAAAAFQAGRKLVYEYEIVPTSCLVELDEEPPHPLNPQALDLALIMAGLLHARPVDEIEVMRKIVVDGSNTSGFQRTALVAVDGRLTVNDRTYTISTICLEEDAARKVSEKDGRVRYRLDRLGIPLIEIATGPEIRSGTEAREVAEEIGALLRATGRVRRGIGTIREDLNVSTDGGARVEIKGVQDLRLIHRYADLEEERQQVLLRIRDRLLAQAANVTSDPAVPVGDLVSAEATGPIGELLRRSMHILGIRLSGFQGCLGPQTGTEVRLGRELAERARATGLRGLLHSDELPGHGISEAAVHRVRERTACGPKDAFVIVASSSTDQATAALAAIRSRAAVALAGIPEETRDPLPDGRTRYSRPLPGRDRMYPETDIPPILVTPEHLARIRSEMPETPDATRRRIQETYGLSPEMATLLIRAGEIDRFESLTSRGHPSASVARLLTQDIPALESAPTLIGDDPLRIELLDQLLSAVERGDFAKEAIPGILGRLREGPTTLEEAVRAVGAGSITREELEAITRAILERNRALIEQRGGEAFSGLMGDVMKEVRGRRDGKEVAEVLRLAIAEEIRKKVPPA